MQYFDEMRDKNGFSDGSAYPAGIEKYRAVYVRFINIFAEKLGSNIRAAAFDRGGMHNWCRIVFYSRDDIKNANTLAPIDLEFDSEFLRNLPECSLNDQFGDVLHLARSVGADIFVQTVVEIDRESISYFVENGLEKFITSNTDASFGG